MEFETKLFLDKFVTVSMKVKLFVKLLLNQDFHLMKTLLTECERARSELSNDILVYESEKIIIFYRLEKSYSCLVRANKSSSFFAKFSVWSYLILKITITSNFTSYQQSNWFISVVLERSLSLIYRFFHLFYWSITFFITVSSNYSYVTQFILTRKMDCWIILHSKFSSYYPYRLKSVF